MLTKWGAALGLASAGRIASGGGGNTGVPLGPFNDWSELPASAQDEAFAVVSDLGPTNSYGLATYNASGGQWKLQFGYFETLADLNAFTDPKALTAVAAVGPSLDEPDSVRYQWDDPNVQWLRTPDPVDYIYAATDWADLPTQDTIQTDDEAVVASLGLGNAYGRAVYDGTDWLLSRAWFDTVADMTAFAQPIATGALASVEASASDDENGVRYQYEGSWTRTAALTTGYAWDITDLTNIDPSGIGATQIGDFARYTDPTTGEVAVYRLRSVPAVGSINLTVWVPASIYGEAGLTIRGYLIGTETMPASGGTIQGYTVTTSGGTASVTTSGGEVVLASTTSGHFANLKSTYVLTEDDRVYVRLNLRLSQASGVNITFYNALYDNGTTKSQFITAQNPTAPSGNTGKYLPTTGGVVLVGSTAMIRSTGTAIGNTAELLEILADGTLEAGSPPNPNFMVNVSRNARPYFSMRRRAQTGTETGQHLLQVFNGATGAQTASFSYLYFMTY
jgi:hypothetical protein